MTGMLIRSAFWIGAPRAGQELTFAAAINDELVPAMRRFPGVRSVNALWPVARENDPPHIHCQVIVAYDSDEDMQRMLHSKERAALRPRVQAALELFEGTLSHIDYRSA